MVESSCMLGAFERRNEHNEKADNREVRTVVFRKGFQGLLHSKES